MSLPDPTERFGDRVADYVRYRPSYPAEILDLLTELGALRPGDAVVDLGAGTGLLTQVLLDGAHPVLAVEPNGPMRDAMHAAMGQHPQLRISAGTAEASELEPQCADLVAAAQAFHWFDPQRTTEEVRRICRSPHRVALMWNRRRTVGDAFSEGYEAMLQQFGTDYRLVDHRNTESRVDTFFRPGTLREGRLPNAQTFDRAGVIGRLSSSSYAPKPGHPDYQPMMGALGELLDRCCAVDGTVQMTYDLQVYCGEV